MRILTALVAAGVLLGISVQTSTSARADEPPGWRHGRHHRAMHPGHHYGPPPLRVYNKASGKRWRSKS